MNTRRQTALPDPRDAGYLPEECRPAIEMDVPDWRRWRERIYPKANELTAREWAWEFLRRNPDYQHYWTRDIGPRYAPDWSLMTPPPMDTAKWAGRFGLLHPLDPAKGAVDPPFIAFTKRRAWALSGPGEVTMTLTPDEAAVVVDLSRPLAPQLREATRKLPKHKQHRRLRTDKYSTYLCVLDAVADGASHAEIGKVLYPSKPPTERKNQVKNDMRAAQAMSWEGYWFIAARG